MGANGKHKSPGRAAAETLAGLEGRNVVVATETMGAGASVARGTLLAARDHDRDAMLVAAARPPQPELLEAGVRVVDATPGETADSRADEVVSPGELTGMGMPVSEFLGDARQPVMVVDSLTTLLQYNDRSTAFRFLSVMAAQLRRTGGVGLCVFSPACHDQRTVHTFDHLFDGRAVVSRDGVQYQGLPVAEESPTPR